MSGRPLDVLEATLEERVTVRLKDGATYTGELGGYDQHLNVVLEPESGIADGPEEAVESTTIIRGDNVVSVSP